MNYPKRYQTKPYEQVHGIDGRYVVPRAPIKIKNTGYVPGQVVPPVQQSVYRPVQQPIYQPIQQPIQQPIYQPNNKSQAIPTVTSVLSTMFPILGAVGNLSNWVINKFKKK